MAKRMITVEQLQELLAVRIREKKQLEAKVLFLNGDENRLIRGGYRKYLAVVAARIEGLEADIECATVDANLTQGRKDAEGDGSHGAALLASFDAALDVRPHLAIEIGYTRCTDWMVHIWDVTGVGLAAAPKIICTQSPDREEAMSQATAKLREMLPAMKVAKGGEL